MRYEHDDASVHLCDVCISHTWAHNQSVSLHRWWLCSLVQPPKDGRRLLFMDFILNSWEWAVSLSAPMNKVQCKKTISHADADRNSWCGASEQQKVVLRRFSNLNSDTSIIAGKLRKEGNTEMLVFYGLVYIVHNTLHGRYHEQRGKQCEYGLIYIPKAKYTIFLVYRVFGAWGNKRPDQLAKI